MVDDLDTVKLTCSDCKRTKSLQLSGYGLTKRLTPLKHTCQCGHIDTILVEKKSRPGKDLCLAGTFTASGQSPCGGRMVIKKLNRQGLALMTDGEQNLKPGRELILEFVLDDAKQSIVKKQVKILAKNGCHLTAQFTSKTHPDNLGPYLDLIIP